MSVLVTVEGTRCAVDLEVDETRPVGDLLESLGVALGEPSPVAGLRTSDGRLLAPKETLDVAGVLDGHRLTLVPPPETEAVAPVIACYVVADTSDSMAGSALDALNAELARLVDALRSDARLRQNCQLAVVTFDIEAYLRLPLTPIADLSRTPRLAATRPATNYEAAFRFLRAHIPQDFDRLRAARRRPLRPVAFFLTDGRPTRGHWPAAHAELGDPSWPDAPHLVAFGFGEAAAFTVRRVGTAGAHLPAFAPGVPAGPPADMTATIITFLVDALRDSPGPAGRYASDDTGGSAVSHAPKGWRSLDEARR